MEAAPHLNSVFVIWSVVSVGQGALEKTKLVFLFIVYFFFFRYEALTKCASAANQ